MTARFFYRDDSQTLVKLEDGRSTIWADGAWQYAPFARWNVGRADARELTAGEAEQLIAAGRVNGERFVWTEEDFASGGVWIE